jgi:ammonia channel protein AmtB
MLSTVLVLGMLPGLAFFEAGLLNHKTTISRFGPHVDCVGLQVLVCRIFSFGGF